MKRHDDVEKEKAIQSSKQEKDSTEHYFDEDQETYWEEEYDSE